MTKKRNPRYWLEKKARRKTPTYPLATIAYYGPDAQFASKVVVGILKNESEEDVADMRKWFSSGKDVRLDMDINQEILEFINSHDVESIVMTDRLIGCPHEEGIDYPLGETCPQCPYWANRDRWTGELIE